MRAGGIVLHDHDASRTKPIGADRPLASIVMIFLNAERFMEEAIESVLGQTWSNWELLFVDDGSTDGSARIAHAYCERDPSRFRYLAHPGRTNRGTGPSRNLGLSAARGECVAFLDADDVYLPERIERHAAVLAERQEVGLVISKDLYWRSWDGRHGATSDEILGPCVTPGVVLNPPDLLVITLSTRGAAMPGICSITFRRNAAGAFGMIPERFVDQYEDQALIAGLMIRCHVVVLDECLARYRQHEGSLTHLAAQRGEYRPGRSHQAYFDYLRWLSEFAQAGGVRYAALERAISRRLWPIRHPLLGALFDRLRATHGCLRAGLRRLVSFALPGARSDGLLHWHARRKNERLARRVRRRQAAIRGVGSDESLR